MIKEKDFVKNLLRKTLVVVVEGRALCFPFLYLTL
jgi:hypothetical protein